MKQEVAELYRVFQPYRLGPDFSGCSHCVDPVDTEHLASTEIRNLTLADLESYAFKAMTTWGDTHHFKHFVPRLFEIASTDSRDFLNLEVLFGKLDYGKWLEWPDAERRAVSDFLHAFWRSIINCQVTAEHDATIDTALCAIGNACAAVTPFLEEWLSFDSQTATQQLAQFVLFNIHDIRQHQRLVNPFWQERSDQAREVLDWLRLPATYEYLYDNQSRLDARLAQSVSVLAGL